jgi:hypothetical protein
VNTTSGRAHRPSRRIGMSFRYRSPRRWSSLRSASSGLVSVRRFARIDLRVPGVLADGLVAAMFRLVTSALVSSAWLIGASRV